MHRDRQEPGGPGAAAGADPETGRVTGVLRRHSWRSRRRFRHDRRGHWSSSGGSQKVRRGEQRKRPLRLYSLDPGGASWRLLPVALQARHRTNPSDSRPLRSHESPRGGGSHLQPLPQIADRAAWSGPACRAAGLGSSDHPRADGVRGTAAPGDGEVVGGVEAACLLINLLVPTGEIFLLDLFRIESKQTDQKNSA